MQSPVPNRTPLKVLKQNLKNATDEHFRVKDSYLNEALARGFGYRTYASFIAGAKEATPPLHDTFDYSAFVARLTELSNDHTAETVGVFLEGVRVIIRVEKYPPEQQRVDRYTDIAYDVTVEVSGLAPETIEKTPQFFVPEFGTNGVEPFRLDSHHAYRADNGYAVTRGRSGEGILTAKLINGCWKGGLFIYAPEHQLDDARCIRSVKASLVRAILPALTSHVHCCIFRPDHYQYGAWRVQLSIGSTVKAHLSGAGLAFDLPDLPSRHLVISPDYRFDIGAGKFENGLWCADLYSNGIPEDENPTSIADVKAKLLASVNEKLRPKI